MSLAPLAARFDRVSNERLLSGPGLSSIHAALASGAIRSPASGRSEDFRDPAAIVDAALAGDMALVHGTRTVLIAGGIVPRFIPFLRSSDFHERSLARGRMSSHLASTAIRVITHAAPGLLGAAMYLRNGAHRAQGQ